MLDLSERKFPSEKIGRPESLVSQKSNKSDYFTNLRDKYSNKKIQQIADIKVQNSKRFTMVPKSQSLNRTRVINNKISNTVAKFGFNAKAKRSDNTSKPLSYKGVLSTRNDKAPKRDYTYNPGEKTYSIITNSPSKSNKVVKRDFSKRKTSAKGVVYTSKVPTPDLRVKTNQMSSSNTETKYSSQTTRSNFKRFKQTMKSHKPVKKINVNLDSVHQTYTLEDYEDALYEDEVNLFVSSSSHTEFNVLSSNSGSMNAFHVAEKPAVKPINSKYRL